MTRAKPLGCHVTPLKPVLNFAFRYQAGFRASLPTMRFAPDNNTLAVVFRVRPEGGGQEFVFSQLHRFRRPRRSRQTEASFQGGFFLGEGRYRVDWAMIDNQGRACEKSWKVGLKYNNDDRKMPALVAAGTAAPLVVKGFDQESNNERPYRVAVMVHAAPFFPRSMKVNTWDQAMLLSTVNSVLDRTPFAPTSLTVFNLAQQQELYRSESPGGDAFQQVAEAINKMELGTVDVRVLNRVEGHFELLAKLLNREMAAPEPPDAVVIVGPYGWDEGKFPAELIESGGKKPLLVYLRLDVAVRYSFADVLERLVKQVKGKVFHVRHPRQLASALHEVEDLLARSKGAPSAAE